MSVLYKTSNLKKIAQMIGEGKSNKQIALAFAVDTATVIRAVGRARKVNGLTVAMRGTKVKTAKSDAKQDWVIAMENQPMPPSARKLADCDNHHCRWPVGTKTGYFQMLCGANKSADKSKPYCAKHSDQAWVKRRPFERGQNDANG